MDIYVMSLPPYDVIYYNYNYLFKIHPANVDSSRRHALGFHNLHKSPPYRL